MKTLNDLFATAPACDYSPERLAQARADTVNATEGTMHLEDGHNCPRCRNRGYIATVEHDGVDPHMVIHECRCKPMRRCIRAMQRSGLEADIRRCTLDAYEATEPWQKEIKAGAAEYARDPQGWLLMLGQSGCGKTHLCTAVCRELLLKGREVLYLPWQEEVARLKGLISEGDAYQRRLDEIMRADVLYIDDLYKAAPSAADRRIVYELICYRDRVRLPTIISSELYIDDLIDIDQATASRMVERAGHHLYEVDRDERRNHRLRHIHRL